MFSNTFGKYDMMVDGYNGWSILLCRKKILNIRSFFKATQGNLCIWKWTTIMKKRWFFHWKTICFHRSIEVDHSHDPKKQIFFFLRFSIWQKWLIFFPFDLFGLFHWQRVNETINKLVIFREWKELSFIIIDSTHYSHLSTFFFLIN